MLAKGDFIAPIPGSRKHERIEENLGAAGVDLTESELEQIETELAKLPIHGNRTMRISQSCARQVCSQRVRNFGDDLLF